jgi:TM2 domain-containing membrane protein YozV
MTALISGLVAIVLGLISLILWWSQFLNLLAGGIPLILLLGGALVVYLGYEEAKDKICKKTETPTYEPLKVTEAEVEYRVEEERLEAEIEEPEKKTKPKKKTEPKKETSQ